MTSAITTLEPQSIDDAMSLARAAYASKLYNVASPEAALMILLTGRDLGLTASQSLRAVYVVSGKPVVSSDAMVAAIRRSGLCASWRVVETTVERCTIETTRRGEDQPERETFDLSDARRAGLDRKDVWRAYPRDMLRHRCAAALARRVYPDVILGCYAPGELDEPPVPAVVTSASPLTAAEVVETYDAAIASGTPADVAYADAKSLARDHKVATKVQALLFERERAEAEAKRAEFPVEVSPTDPREHPACVAFVDQLASAETPAAVIQVCRECLPALREAGADVTSAAYREAEDAWHAVGGVGALRDALRKS